MKYDKYTKLVERIILLLHELKPTDHLTYSDLIVHFPQENVNSLKKVLESHEYDFLFNTDCECNRGKGKSMENMYLLSVDGERIVAESETWNGRVTFSYKKPLKLYSFGDRIKRLRSPASTLIICLWAVISTAISTWLIYRQVKNEELNNIDSKDLSQKDEIIYFLQRENDSLRMINLYPSLTKNQKLTKPKENIVYTINETDSIFSGIKFKRFQIDITNTGEIVADSIYVMLRTYSTMDVGADPDLRLVGKPYSIGDTTITYRFKKIQSLKPKGLIHIEIAMDANDYENHKKAFYRSKQNANINIPLLNVESSMGFGKLVDEF